MKILVLLLLGLFTSQCIGYSFNLRVGFFSPLCLTVNDKSGSDGAGFSVSTCLDYGFSNGDEYYQTFTKSAAVTMYEYKPATHGAYCLDIVGGTWNEVRAQEQYCLPTLNYRTQLSQLWYQEPHGSAFWLRHYLSGRCMTSEGGDGVGDNYIDIYDCTEGAKHQLWNVLVGSYSYFNRFQNVAYGNCLEPNAVVGSAGLGFRVDTCSVATDFLPVKEYLYTYRVDASRKCLDGGSTSGGNVFQYTCYPTAKNHQWLPFSYPGEGEVLYFYIRATNTGLCLTWSVTDYSVFVSACQQGNVQQQFYETIV